MGFFNGTHFLIEFTGENILESVYYESLNKDRLDGLRSKTGIAEQSRF